VNKGINVMKKAFICAQLLLLMLYAGCGTATAPNEEPARISSSEEAARFHARGLNYSRLQEYAQAIASFSEAVKIDPEFRRAYVSRGAAYFAIGRYSEALEDINYAISLGLRSGSADYAAAHHARGDIYVVTGEYEKATDDYTKAIEAMGLPEAYYARSLAYHFLGRLTEALADLNAAINIDPSNYLFFHNRGSIYFSLKDYPRAQEDWKMSINLNPNYALAYFNCGVLARELGQYEESLNYFNRAIMLDPASFLAYNGRGAIHGYQNDHLEAIRDFSRAIEINPNHPDGYSGRGWSYFNMEMYNEAVADYSAAIALYPNMQEIYNETTYYHSDTIYSFLFYPDISAYYFRRGTAYYLLEEYDEALSDLNKALELNPGNKYAYAIRAGVYMKLWELTNDIIKRNEYLERAGADYERGQ
jgi:tetratricopeptide (TPR) repeat protein